MPAKLTGLKINEVSAVDKAANGRTFLIVKRADGGSNGTQDTEKKENPIIKAMHSLVNVLKGASDDDMAAMDFNQSMEERKQQELEWQKDSALWDGISALRESIDSISDDDSITDKVGATVQSMMQFVAYLQANSVIKSGKKISGERMGKLKDLHSQLGELISGADDDITSGNEPGEEGTTKQKGSVAKVADNKFPAGHPEGCMCTKCADVRGAAKKSFDDSEIIKRLTDLETESAEIKKSNEDLIKKNQSLEDEIKKRDEQAKETEIKKSFEGMDLSVDIDAMMPVLKSLYGTDAYEKMVAQFKAADAQVKKGALFAETGTDGVVESDVEKQISAKADEIVKRDGCSKEQAITKALRENPDLYKKYNQAQK